MSFSQPKNFEINGGTFTNVAGSHYNTKHLIVQQSDIARAPDSLINTIDAATSSELRTQATQLTESSPINATGAVVNNIARDNYNVKNLSLSYRDSGTSTLSVLLDATSPSAAFNSRERHPPPKCHPGTRQAILDEITAWVDLGPGEDDAERILWVHGPAGAGKSAVAQTIAENCDHKKLLAASFFFSRAHAARNSIDRLFITIAYQLAVSISPLRPEILSSFSNDPSIVNQAISAQVDKLIIAPFQALAASQAQSSHAEPSPFIVIIDGLDECAEKGNQSEVLDHVLRLIKIPAITLRFLIVSRPEHTIKDTLEQHEFSVVSSTPVDLYVDLDNDLGAWEDVYDYLNHEFARIRDSPKHRSWMSRFRDTPWPTESEVDCLVEKSGGYFIYAVTLAKFVDQENTSPITRLAFILSSESSQDDPFEELDKLYHHILTEVINTLVDHIQNTAVHNLKRKRSDLHQDTSLRHRQQAFTVLQEVLRAVAGEVPDDFIAEFYGLDNDQVLLTFRGLQSIMLFDDGFGDYEDMLSYCAPSTHRPAHATVYDFLFDPARAGHFHISPVSESFWADQFCLMLDYLHRYNQYTETMDWSQPPREPSLRTVIYINRNILSVWTKAGPSNQSALLKAIQTKSHNFWFPLPPSAPALPWGDVKFVSLCAACLSSVVMLTDAVLKGWYASLASYFKQVCDTVLKPLFSPPQHLFESERIISVYAVHSVPPINMGTVTMLLGLQHPLHPPIQKLLYILGRSYNIFPYLQHTLVSGEVANIRMVTLCLELIATADMDDTLADVNGAHSYARTKWSWFLKDVLPGDKDLLDRLESLPRNIIFGSEYFSSQLYEIEEIERAGGHLLPRSICWTCNNGVAIEEIYHSSILQKIVYHAYSQWRFYPSATKKCNARALFLQHDTRSAVNVINWLKKHDPPPHDLLAKWEAYLMDLCAAQKYITEVVLVRVVTREDGTNEEFHEFNPIGGPLAPFESQIHQQYYQIAHMPAPGYDRKKANISDINSFHSLW